MLQITILRLLGFFSELRCKISKEVDVNNLGEGNFGALSLGLFKR